ncbi:hypothetical protein [Rhodobacter sp. 24-YEA-8]|nr:hypothetical protein [Rhodobacter sp. 24-YEA-8]SEB72563.1 hypothetical protein SAMN05519105_1181 [Rhodobacter sp. 24-YEA-8]
MAGLFARVTPILLVWVCDLVAGMLAWLLVTFDITRSHVRLDQGED